MGGISQAETDAHFAQQFPGSVARAQLALLDPHGHILHVADALARQLTGGDVAVLDLPSGAGALGLAFLCTIAELRASAVLPRHPLDVVLVGGEISGPARKYAEELLAAVNTQLARQAIFVKHSQLPWDACDQVSTTRLIQEFLRTSVACPRRLVAISNFSGFLHRAGKMKDATPQLNDVFRMCSGPGSVAVWLEPHMNAATAPGGIFERLVGLAREKLRRFVTLVRPVPAQAEDEPLDHGRTQANYSLPLTPESHAPVRLAVLQFDLSGGH